MSPSVSVIRVFRGTPDFSAFSFRSLSAATRPLLAMLSVTYLEDSPIDLSFLSMSARMSCVIMLRNCVVAMEALPVVLVRNASAPPTSPNETPISLARGRICPKTGANVLASALPSRTAATRMSTAFVALRLAGPYAFIADVAAFATSTVSPSPALAALAEIVRVSRASFPLMPEPVMNSIAFASSSGDLATGPARPRMSFLNPSTSSAAMPTRPSILESAASNWAASLLAAPPMPASGAVIATDIIVPMVRRLRP